jgi:hypothetical protein
MQLESVTFVGPALEPDPELFGALPSNLRSLLEQLNGFILYEGGLHVRGVCKNPEWHGLRTVMYGESALHRLYPALRTTDVPFAQDCVADQYVLRDRIVSKLEAETGTLLPLALTLPAFFEAIQANPIEFLGMQPLLRHEQESGALQPGQVLHVYPPFCTREAADGVSLKAVPVAEAIAFLADFAHMIGGLSEGEQFRVRVVP